MGADLNSFGAPLCETFGRKAVFLTTTPIFALFILGAGFSQSAASLVTCRFFAGVFACEFPPTGYICWLTPGGSTCHKQCVRDDCRLHSWQISRNITRVLLLYSILWCSSCVSHSA